MKTKNAIGIACSFLLVALLLLAALVPVRASAWDGDGDPGTRTPEYTTWDDLAGKTVGIITGATIEGEPRDKCPDVGKVVYYTANSDLIAALRAGKIDAFITRLQGSSRASSWGAGEYAVRRAYVTSNGSETTGDVSDIDHGSRSVQRVSSSSPGTSPMAVSFLTALCKRPWTL